MSLEKRFDELQKEFFELYNKIYDEELTLYPNDIDGGISRWSASYNFDHIPLKIERSWGNLNERKIFDSRPSETGRISEAIYDKGFLGCVKFWRDSELEGFANFEKLGEDTIKEIRIYDEELAGISYFYFNGNHICKSITSNITGIIQEEYLYKDNKITTILTNERQSADYIYELPNGITDKPIRNVEFKVEYKDGEVSAVYNGNGENMYVKK